MVGASVSDVSFGAGFTVGESRRCQNELSDHEILRTALRMKPRFKNAHHPGESKRGAAWEARPVAIDPDRMGKDPVEIIGAPR